MDECLRLGLALTTALEHLHRHGLVHRDIKPSNIVFVNGIPKLADIGLVALAEATMSFVGTEGYLPPEGPGTVQADLFSLGKVLYEISTGHDRQQFPELPTGITELPDRAALAEFNEVLLRACAPDVKQRYESAAEMHADLALLQSGKSVARMRARAPASFRPARRCRGHRIAALAAGLYLWQARQTKIVRELATENLTLAQRADANATLAQNNEATARERLYAADINLAHQALKTDNLRLARSLLRITFLSPANQTCGVSNGATSRNNAGAKSCSACRATQIWLWVLALAPDARNVVVGGEKGITKMLDLQLRREVASFRCHRVLPCRFHALAISWPPAT